MFLAKIVKKIIILLNYFTFHFLCTLKVFPKVYNSDETVQKIINEKLSVSRFGDGEFHLIRNIGGVNFQHFDSKLSNRLKEILISDIKGHIVCIPNVFISRKHFTKDSENYWTRELRSSLLSWLWYTKRNIKYGDTQFTRFYMDLKDKSHTLDYTMCLKKIWNERNLLIVEGAGSRLGVGNDLFANALSIKRIICPNKNAFVKYDKILKKTIEFAQKDNLILIALGPTATVLAYDLHLKGFQSIDIGHIDIEYEWFLKGALRKVAVEGKNLNEVSGYIETSTSNDIKYNSEILYCIS